MYSNHCQVLKPHKEKENVISFAVWNSMSTIRISIYFSDILAANGRMLGGHLGPWSIDEISEVGNVPIDSVNRAHLMWWIRQYISFPFDKDLIKPAFSMPRKKTGTNTHTHTHTSVCSLLK